MLRKFANAANKEGLIPWVLNVSNTKENAVHDLRGPTPEEIHEILTSIAKDNSPRGRRAYACVRLMADLGLRRSSVLGLDFNDIQPKRRRIKVHLKGYTNKRWKQIPKPTLEALNRWIAVHPNRARQSGPVFVNLIKGRGERLSGPGFFNEVIYYTSNGGKRTRPHGFRHSAITNAIINAAKLNETLDSVMQFSDHADFRMVLRYRDKSKDAQRNFAEANAADFGDPLAN